MEEVIAQYKECVRPRYKEFVEPSMKHAHIITENTYNIYATPEGLRFNIARLIASLHNKDNLNIQKRFKLFPPVQIIASAQEEITAEHQANVL